MQQTYQYAAMLGRVMYTIKDDPTLLYLVLKDPELSKWWRMRKSKEASRVAKEAERKRVEEEKQKLAEIKKNLMKTLTDDEKKALGLIPV